jgi:exopolysaccharide production protein ExoZ
MYLSLQICRALAALMVVCFHVGGNLRRDRYLGDAAAPFERFFSFGDAGVSFFFVLSGFIVTWVHLRDFNQPDRLAGYLFKRAARIYPVYWIVFTITYAAAYMSPSLRDTVPHDMVTLLKSLLLMPQDPMMVGALGAPVLFVAWSLQYEMCFYIALAMAIVCQWLLVIPVSLFLLNQFSPLFGDGYLHTFFSNPRIYLFLMGVGLAYIAREKWTIGCPKVLVAGAASAFIGLSALEVLGCLPGDRSAYVLAFGAICTIGLFGLIRMEDSGVRPAKTNWLVRLGDASYVLYLVHVPVLSALCKFAKTLTDLWGPFGPAGAALAAIFIVLACCAVAMGFHIFVERPIMRSLNTLSRFLFSDRVKAQPPHE